MTDETKFIEKNRKIINHHNKLFNGHFLYHVPDGRLFYEDDNEAYFIPDNISAKKLMEIINDDITKGNNSLPEKFKDNIIIYDPDKIY